MRRFWSGTGGQEAVEYALLSIGVLIPMIFAIVFTAEILWIWHSVVDFTRDGARYAATHCWQSDTTNVTNYMTTHVPRMIDMDQFQNGTAQITVQYYQRDPNTGLLAEFACENGECSTSCVPDTVTVSVTNYRFGRFVNFLKLPPVTLPDFRASVAGGSAGCDETGSCLP